MPNAYDNPEAAEAFDQFLASPDGQMQQEILYENILPFLADPSARILDAACGQGWLAGKLTHQLQNVEAFDSSRELIERAKKNFPGVNFQTADLTTTIPYQDNTFDTVILNMAAHDMSDLAAAFRNLNRVLKKEGTFIMTIANPYYAFPVGVWKRGLIGKILQKLPRLIVRPYHHFSQQKNQLQNWREQLSSYFYPLQEYMNQALAAGFSLEVYRDLQSPTDSSNFNVRYQMHRFPLILLLVFKKRSE
jgi:ubiquinone/menaquinone biosynthesis C-methylase UbiE